MRSFLGGAAWLVFLTVEVAGAAEVIDPTQAKADPKDPVLWYDARLLGIEGQGWSDTKSPFDRLPAKAEGVVRDPVWNLSRSSAGLAVRFATEATPLHARWTLTSANLALPHMPATGVSGLDLYVRHGDQWRWVGAGRPAPNKGVIQSATLVSGLPAGQREFLLYLPLYNGVTSLELGIGKEQHLAKADARPAERRKPIVFYGTSITQGGCASRPGMVHTAILGRRLGCPIINLGFSGNGKMEPEMARLLAELDPAIYVIECVPNMSAPEVSDRAESLVQTIRNRHPKTPIVLAEDPTYSHAFLLPDVRQRTLDRRAALRKVYDRLTAAKVANVHYLPGDKFYGEDGEATVDGVHATDLGFLRLADAYQPVLEPLLPRRDNGK